MKMIQKTTAFERINHWVLMVSFAVLLLTGIGFSYHSLSWLNTVFFGVKLVPVVHEWSGVAFAISMLFTMGSYIEEAMKFGPEDQEWLRSMGGYLDKSVHLPPQGRMNFGQKMFYLVVVVGCGALITVSGLVMWLYQPGKISVLLHNLSFSLMAVSVPVHIYLATAANPGVFRVMTRGTVPLDWARKHHGKWVKELGL